MARGPAGLGLGLGTARPPSAACSCRRRRGRARRSVGRLGALSAPAACLAQSGSGPGCGLRRSPDDPPRRGLRPRSPRLRRPRRRAPLRHSLGRRRAASVRCRRGRLGMNQSVRQAEGEGAAAKLDALQQRRRRRRGAARQAKPGASRPGLGRAAPPRRPSPPSLAPKADGARERGTPRADRAPGWGWGCVILRSGCGSPASPSWLAAPPPALIHRPRHAHVDPRTPPPARLAPRARLSDTGAVFPKVLLERRLCTWSEAPSPGSQRHARQMRLEKSLGLPAPRNI